MDASNTVIKGTLFFYTWRFFGTLIFPFFLIHPKFRKRLFDTPKPPPGKIWIHGASLGEHQAIAGLETIMGQDNWRTYSSFRTPIPRAWPAPMDLPFFFQKWLKESRPAMLILMESEWWPGWLHHVHKQGIPIVCCNAKSGKTQSRYKAFGLWKWATSKMTLIGQDETGDLKASAPTDTAPFRLPGNWLIAGSIRESDEDPLLAAWKQLDPPLHLLIAPRHLKSIPVWEKKLKSQGFDYQLRSKLVDDPTGPILLLDTLGELKNLFSQGQIAYIGGTFDSKIGGHSPTEASKAGLPVAGGPYRHANPQAWEESVGAVCSKPEELTATLQSIRQLPIQKPMTSAAAFAVCKRLPTRVIPPETAARTWLKPAQFLYKAIAKRNINYRSTPMPSPCPTISVGGIAMGGTGKTPICNWLAEQFDGAFVIGRGYKRPISGPTLRTEEGLGDELEMLRRRGKKVISCPDRIKAAQWAVKAGAKLLILDDAFQHRKIQRHLDIVTIDSRWPTAQGLFPAGWGREEWSSIKRADFIWLHNYDPHLPLPSLETPFIKSQLTAVSWLHQGKRLPLEAFEGDAHVACAIAKPSAFLSMLAPLNITPISWQCKRDHQALKGLPKGSIITEKDAARLPNAHEHWVLECDLTVEGADELLLAIEKLL